MEALHLLGHIAFNAWHIIDNAFTLFCGVVVCWRLAHNLELWR
jgi:hypothetical protein